MEEKRRGTLRRVIRLALPAVFENVMFTLVNIVDVAMVGSLGAVATAAAALNAQPMWLAYAVTMIAAGGASVLVARCWGAKDYALAGRYAAQAVVLGALIGLCMTAAAEFGAGLYVALMHAAPDVAPDAAAYMRIVGASLPFLVAERTMAGVLQSAGDTVTPMKISVAANLCNVAGNFLLIYPRRNLDWLGGLPVWGMGWGVRGAAVSTAVSIVLAAAAMAAALRRRRDELELSAPRFLRFEKKRLDDLLRVGLPIAAERIVLSSGQILYMSVISALGTVAVSAHYLATTAEGVCYNPVYGIAIAATTLVGQALGAGDERRAEAEGRACIHLCLAVMAVVSTGMYFGAEWLIRVFTSDAAVIEQGARALRIVAWVETLFGAALTSSGALRGAGDTVVPLWLGIFSMMGLRLGAAWLFVNKLGLGLAGAWYAMDLDVGVRGALLWLYFNSGRWKLKSRRLAARTGQ